MNQELELPAVAVQLALFVAALAFVRWDLYEGYRVDVFRQRLFELRHELFKFAASGGIAFDDRAYQLLRWRMNRLIRFAHTYSMMHLVLAVAFEDKEIPRSEVEQVLEDLPEGEAKQQLEWINMRVTVYFAWHLVGGSWMAMTVVMVLYGVSQFGAGVKKLVERCIVRLPGLAVLERHTYAH